MRITGVSNIDFRAGFSTQPSLDLNHTIEWPLQGMVLRTLGTMQICLLKRRGLPWGIGEPWGAGCECVTAVYPEEAGLSHSLRPQ